MPNVSVLIPARNEVYLQKTVDSILKSAEGDIEIIVVLDGYWPEPIIKDDPKVTLIHHTSPIGQRAAVNEAARIAKGRYILKTDGHSAFDKGFDRKLILDCKYDWTVIPRMYNLDVKTWKPKKHKWTDYMYISGSTFEKPFRAMYYDYEYQRPKRDILIDDVMTGQGACWFMHKDRFWELGGMDEGHGGWGQVGVEVALKAWLSGGSLKVNKKTWFAHYFRGGGGPGFPYQISGKAVDKARKYSQDLWFNNKWEKQKRNFGWLLDRFNPPTWDDDIEVSVLIPARNEKYLQRTIDDLLEHLQTRFEILVGVDNYNPDPPLKEDKRVKVYRASKRLGMRPMINKLASLAKGKYLLRADAHISIDKGMDKKMIASHQPGYTVVARRYLLDSKTWQRRERTDCDYRYLTPLTDERGGLRSLAWEDHERKRRDKKIDDLMTCSGSNWLMERKQWNRWGGLDESHGTFGQEGAEIACMTWLSGGRMIINKNTWYAHWNRGKHPFSLGANEKKKSINYSVEKWTNDKWKHQKHKFQWLIDKFKPPGWEVKREYRFYHGYRVRKYEVDEFYNNYENYADPNKRSKDNPRGVHEFQKTFRVFVDDVLNGTIKFENHIYFDYLVKHLHPADRNPLTPKGRRYVLKKLKGTVGLIKDIKKNGVKTPIDIWCDGKIRCIQRGQRRVVIAKKLGIKHILARRFDTKDFYLRRREKLDKRSDGRIEKLAIRQFARGGREGTDKYWYHNYTALYDRHLKPLYDKRINLLEIGVDKGASLALWNQTFPKAKVYGIDLKAPLKIYEGVKKAQVLLGDQTDPTFLKGVGNRYGKFSVVIDDGSHDPEHIVVSLTHLWPYVCNGGWYIIEDMWGKVKNIPRRYILMDELKKRVDSICLTEETSEVHFYQNICFIKKAEVQNG